MRTRILTTLLCAASLWLAPQIARAQCDDVDHDGDGCNCYQGDCDDDPTPCPASPNCDPIGGPYIHHCVCGRTQGYLTRGAGCNGGAWPDVCDTKDNDCNSGTVDGSAETWLNQACDSTADADLCTEGVWQCITGVQTCNDPGTQSYDVCNGVDDDCNGATVDGSADPSCGPGGYDPAYCCGSTPACHQCCIASQCGPGAWTCSAPGYTCQCPGVVCNGVCIAGGNCCQATDCGTSGCGNFGACGGYSDTCDESGTWSRSCTTYSCNSNVCGSSTTTDSQPCTRDTDTNVCVALSCPSWGNCGGFSDICDEGGTQARTCTVSTCVTGSCTPGTRDENQNCTRDTDNTPCGGANWICVNGSCSCPGPLVNCGGNCQSANACGGCAVLAGVPGAACGTQGCGSWGCNGTEAVTCRNDVAPTTYYRDHDNDSYGVDGDSQSLCVASGEYRATRGGDCDDNNANRNPGRTEICDGIDNDCDPQVDEGFDLDSDGYFTCGNAGCVTFYGDACDCNDTAGSGAAIHPGATEACDNVDSDCDCSLVDEFTDADTDRVPTCAGAVECNDNSALQHGAWYQLPGCTRRSTTRTVVALAAVAEVCDGRDNDCNGQIDDGLDHDNDGDGSLACGGCIAPAAPNCDCNDNDNSIYPGAFDACDCIDQDCDGSIVDGYDSDADADNVPHCALAVECNDNPPNGNRQHGAWCGVAAVPEQCDTLDNNCSGGADENLSRACYSGPVGTQNIGLCHGGTQVCAAINTNPADPANWGTCNNQVVPAFVPVSETEAAHSAQAPCDGLDNDCDGARDDGYDGDGDGYFSCANAGCQATYGASCDCDDGNPAVHPGAAEVCNGYDDNCNSQVDEALARTCYSGDIATLNVGLCHSGSQACQSPAPGQEGWGTCLNEVLPAAEICDGYNNDCDDQTDEDFDADGDGARSCALCSFLPASACDCDDTRSDVKPGGTEVCDGVDNDCDTRIDTDSLGSSLTQACYSGRAGTQGVGDCHGGQQSCLGGIYTGPCNGEVVPAASDVCDGHDNNCNGSTDEGFDQDGDGVTTCGGDCNDTDPDMYPGNLEICDSKDNDCDSIIDGVQTACYSASRNTLDVGTCHAGQSDCLGGVPVGDCLGEVTPTTEHCDLADDDCDGLVDENFDLDVDGAFDCLACAGVVPADQCDCDDHDAFNRPGAVEVCDCTDNNCDGQTDEGGACDGGACHDLDQDGYTNCDGDCNDRDSHVGPGFAEIFGNGKDDDCDGAIDEDVDEDHDGWATRDGDCDDRFVEINPSMAEVCDGFDNNCDGRIDEGFDLDNDRATTCAGDCDDTDPLRSPLRREICGNGIDDDCDGRVDPDVDVDGDGVTTCGGDCNDFNAAVHGANGTIAAAAEVCDGQDNDCDGYADASDTNGDLTLEINFDQDGDRWYSCLGDCDDADPNINPDHLEVPGNGKDDDCDGQVDEGNVDSDHDGFTPNCGDCNDGNPLINPHAAEDCDRVDNNCDGYVDAWLGQFDLCATCFDADGDGFTNCDGDCDDRESSVYPGAPEICDLLDNDCDHQVDLDRNGFTVCTDEDAGTLDAAGVDTSGTVVDSGVIVNPPTDAGPAAAEGVLQVGCGCAAAPGAAPWGLLLVVGFGAMLARGRWRRRLGLVSLALLALLTLTRCDSKVRVPGVVEEPKDVGSSTADGGTGHDAQHPPTDAGPLLDVVAADQTPLDAATTACSVDGIIAQAQRQVPGSELPFAVPPRTLASDLEGVEGFALDDLGQDVAGFVLRRALPPGVDASDPATAADIADSEVQYLDHLQLSPAASGRIAEQTRSFVDIWGRPGIFSAQHLEFPQPVTAARVRENVLVSLAHVPPGSVSNLPLASASAIVAQQHMLYLLFFVTPEGVLVIGVVTPEPRYVGNQMLLGDLTNGTHIGVPGYELRRECEVKTLPELQSDFLWVIDNSASMQEEQVALANAAGAFYNALRSSGIDFRLGVVTTDGEVLRGGGFTTDLATFQNNVRVGINGNGREMGLEYGLRAIAASRAGADPSRQLRENAALVVVFVSDEDSVNLLPVDDYVTAYREQGAQVYGIVGPRPWGCQRVGLGVARPGFSYIAVADGTGGSTGSICNPNLAETITAILIGAAGAASKSPLGRLAVSNSLAVRVQMEPGGELTAATRSRSNGFDYEPGGNTILFFGTTETLPPADSLFEVAYQYFAPPEG